MTEKEFVYYLKKLNINISEEKLEKLNIYYEFLIEWNEKFNLTAITEKKDVYLKHFYDSLTISTVTDLNYSLSFCDAGTGAGFPGIVIKILFPNIKLTLLDSLRKRTIFLEEICKKLDIEDVEIFHTRIEDFAKINREKYDIVTARAVSNLNTISELCIPMVKVDGVFISMKGKLDEEIKLTNQAIEILGGKIKEVKKFNLPIDNNFRSLIIITKQAPTHKKYPRIFDQIKKKPL